MRTEIRFGVSEGHGRTLQAAIEHALTEAKVPPPYRFELLTISGNCTADTSLFYSVRVKVVGEETLEATAARRSVGTGELS